MKRRPDESMNLLRTLTEGALEPEYRTTTAPRRTGWVTVLIVGLIASLLTYAVVQTFRNRGVDAAARVALLSEVGDAREHQADLGDRISELESSIRTLQRGHLGDDAERQAMAEAELLSGAVGVEGPGIIVVVDDAPNATASEGRVLDSDLSMLVNGLFEAGAEAVAVNGRRLSTRTPVRSAGAAITVDYVSLSPPYRVEAVGDKDKLPARFALTHASDWWQYLRINYGLTIEVTQADGDLSLPADPGLSVRHAKGA